MLLTFLIPERACQNIQRYLLKNRESKLIVSTFYNPAISLSQALKSQLQMLITFIQIPKNKKTHQPFSCSKLSCFRNPINPTKNKKTFIINEMKKYLQIDSINHPSPLFLVKSYINQHIKRKKHEDRETLKKLKNIKNKKNKQEKIQKNQRYLKNNKKLKKLKN
ncbi:hypothetical protein TTHERM_001014719 (macronuclear) [Tetrahymena thermophila SB210]|uniref:Uncharacterized protein n=1 Tax=Tetrahymena thermophila (strain SB210) TaxID=312017 RepID=W7X018_TETTS|nr:hypothetical protein TTHERM_001014719 [Tetrahymena thermophila SB210]EWS72450.1 hypothetical protein TTHERM_001014719 [Tetrahymena thermophila SB210]|eukprot:XP_012655021.1 hypothetical protein TTHERM_001014719 [Tetrahymena thermophila SB210]